MKMIKRIGGLLVALIKLGFVYALNFFDFISFIWACFNYSGFDDLRCIGETYIISSASTWVKRETV